MGAAADAMELNQLEAAIGERGQTKVDSSNRRQVRRWLVAWGLPSTRVQSLTVRELDRLYNDDTALSAELNGQSAQHHNDHREQRGMFDDTSAAAAATSSSGQQDTSAAAQQIAALLTQLTANGQAPVDAEQVRGIVREELDSRPNRTIKVQRPDGTAKIEGAHYAAERVIRTLAAGVHVWLAGPAGSGKTTLAEQAAEALGLSFYSTGAVTSDFRLVGYTTATGELVRTPFREAFEHGGVFLFDEIDASHPMALVALNQALANQRFTFPDGMVPRHPDFKVIAAGNTYGHGATSDYVGRTRIDAATLDRFAFVAIGYDEDVEHQMAGQRPEWARYVQNARAAVQEHGIRHVISPRATEQGARMLEAGIPMPDVVDAVLRKGLDADQWRKIEATAGGAA